MTRFLRAYRVAALRRLRLREGRKTQLSVITLAACAGLACALWGGAWPLEEKLGIWRAQMRSQPASGEVVVVEIDAASIARYKSWPWPRRHHADLVNQLRIAGARSIAFDVDFSAPSRAGDDAALAKALSEFSGGVVLPTFLQATNSTATGVMESAAIPILREHGFLGSVNVFPDSDGSVRHYPYGVVTGGMPRPSIGAAVAESHGEMDVSFTIDQAIDPQTIPRLSFASVAEGRFDPKAVSGKRVIVGATAIEMGDRYVLPRYGLLPGVVVQALAAETLMAGHIMGDWGSFPLLLLALLAVSLLWRPGYVRTGLLAASAICVAILIPLLGEVFGFARLAAAPAIVTILVALVAHLVQLIANVIHRARFLDPESGLPNRAALQSALARVTAGSVIVLHIDRYQDVVGGLDRRQRAQLLAAVAARIRIGNGGAALYRIDNENLAWLAPTADQETLAGIASLVESRLSIDATEIKLRVFMGLAIADDNTADLADQAAKAAQTAQRRGIGMLTFDPLMVSEAADALQFVADIDRALTNADFTLEYQPKQRLSTGELAGVEALVRWQHAGRGRVSPADFVPVIETQGWEARLALAVVECAISDVQEWARSGFATVVAINLSASLLSDEDFCTDLVGRIDSAQLDHWQFGFEVTESAVIGDAKTTAAMLQQFRDQGFKISIDDYGTGQSTLSYLQQLPADEIKIDQSFVRNITQRRADEILVRSTIELAHEMDMVVVAEGIEDAATLDKLRALGADIGQGYVIARPMIPQLVPQWRGARPVAHAA